MKNIILLITSILIISCEKDNRHQGATTALINGENWDGFNEMKPMSNMEEYFYIASATGDIEGNHDILSIFKLPYQEGRYIVHRTNGVTNDSLVGVSYNEVIGGDQYVGGGNVPEIPDSSNYVEITFYDECSQKVEGIFNLTLVGGPEPDTIRFENGQFEGKISDD